MQRTHQHRGFTLIELLTAMAIISLLAAASFRTYVVTLAEINDNQRIAQAREVQQALERYYVNNGRYPDYQTDSSETTLPGNGSNDSGWDDADLLEFIPALYNSNARGDADGNVYLQDYITDPRGSDGQNNVCGRGLFYGVDISGADAFQRYTIVVGLENEADPDVLPVCYRTNPSIMPGGSGPVSGCSNSDRHVCFSELHQ